MSEQSLVSVTRLIQFFYHGKYDAVDILQQVQGDNSLLDHVKMYVLANGYEVQPLMDLAIRNFKKAIYNLFCLYSEIPDAKFRKLLETITFVYSSTSGDDRVLRDLMVQTMVKLSPRSWATGEKKKMSVETLEEVKDFGFDLVHCFADMMREIVDRDRTIPSIQRVLNEVLY
ncbi:Anaphase-promoting complex subunit 23 [Lecanora helva]